MSMVPGELSEKQINLEFNELATQRLTNPLHSHLRALNALRGTHFFRLVPEKGGTSLVIADTKKLGVRLPESVKQAVVAWDDHVLHFVFDSSPEADEEAFLRSAHHGMKKQADGRQEIIEHHGMPPQIEEVDADSTRLMLKIGHTYLGAIRPHISHLNLSAEAEYAQRFLDVTGPFLGHTALHRTFDQLNIHEY